MPSRSSRSAAQAPVVASKHCVVVAFVRSATGSPAEPVVHEVGDEEERLGDLEHRVGLGGHGAPSSKTVLMGRSWMPVRS